MLHCEKQPMLSSSVPNYPFQKIAIDLVGPVNIQSYDGNQYILTCMDMLTSWVEAIPLKSKDTKLVGKLTSYAALVVLKYYLVTMVGNSTVKSLMRFAKSSLLNTSKQCPIMPKQMTNWRIFTNC